MKKLLLLFVAGIVTSCSSDQSSPVNSLEQKASLSVLDGDLLSFKDEASFIKEYSTLSEMKTSKEIQEWISKKKLVSLLNTSSDSLEMQNDIISDSRVIYSDAIKAILNSNSKVKIGSKIIWFNENNLYLLSNETSNKNLHELEIHKNGLASYGKISNLNKNNITNRNTIPNENKIKTYVVNLPNSKRYVLDFFNETIVINDQIASSKMYLRYILQYRSCSFWRCTWKTDTSSPWTVDGGPHTLTSSVLGSNDGFGSWTMAYLDSGIKYGQNTFLLATWGTRAPLFSQFVNFDVSGSVFWKYTSSSIQYPQSITWF